MQNKLLRLTFLTVATFYLCVGCSSVKTPTPSPQSYNKMSSPNISNNIKPQNVVQNIEKTISIPKQLGTIGSNAEGIYIDAAKKDWKKVNDRVSLIKNNYNELKPIMQMTTTSKHLMNNMGVAIDNLDKQVKAKRVYETRFDANQLSKYIPEAYNIFRPTLAGDITKLGYLGREIELNADKAEWKSAKKNLDAALSTWSVLKPKINNTYTRDITGFSNVLQDLEKSVADKNTAAIRNNVNKMLDGIGIIQSDLTKQGVTL